MVLCGVWHMTDITLIITLSILVTCTYSLLYSIHPWYYYISDSTVIIPDVVL